MTSSLTAKLKNGVLRSHDVFQKFYSYKVTLVIGSQTSHYHTSVQ